MNTYAQYTYMARVCALAADARLTSDHACIAYAMGTMADNTTGELLGSLSSYDAISARSGRSRRTVRRAVDCMAELGLVERTPRMIGGSHRGWHISLRATATKWVTSDLHKGVTPDPHEGVTSDPLDSQGGHACPPEGVTPDRLRGSLVTPPTNEATNSETNSETEGGAAVVEVAPAGVPEREAPPSPPPVVVGDEVVEAPQPDAFAADTGLDEDAATFGIKLRGWLERIHGERGHRSDTLARLAAPLLAKDEWDEAKLANRIAAELPAYHARHRHKTRAIASLLTDLASPRPAPESRRTGHRAPPANAYYSDAETARWAAHLDDWDRECAAKAAGGVS